MAVLIRAINTFATLLEILIVARVLLSWFPQLRRSKVEYWINQLTDPIVLPIRQLLSRTPLGGPGMMLDFSPFVACCAVELVKFIILMIVANVIR